MRIRVFLFASVAVSLSLTAVPASAGPANASLPAAGGVRIVPAAARGPITGYTCLSAETSFQRIDEVTLLLDGRELARIDDP